jgi:hypothetical protein
MSAPVIPPDGTIVQTFKRSFADVPIDADKDNAIATTEFLDAAESLTTIFGTNAYRGEIWIMEAGKLTEHQMSSAALPSRLLRVT